MRVRRAPATKSANCGSVKTCGEERSMRSVECEECGV